MKQSERKEERGKEKREKSFWGQTAWRRAAVHLRLVGDYKTDDHRKIDDDRANYRKRIARISGLLIVRNCKNSSLNLNI